MLRRRGLAPALAATVLLAATVRRASAQGENGAAGAAAPSPPKQIVVSFAWRSAELTTESLNALSDFYQMARQGGRLRLVRVQAFQGIGEAGTGDTSLSQRRGGAVAQMCAALGVDPKNIRIEARGTDWPNGGNGPNAGDRPAGRDPAHSVAIVQAFNA